MKLILATHNLHKRSELSELLSGKFEVEVLPKDFPEIEETGTTLDENAILKARTVFEALHLPTLADDTGLEVAALDGAPGVYTARYAGENATYDDNCNKLLAALEGEENREAVFKTVICFIDKNGNEKLFTGIVEGEITREFRGTNGFGYDPVFMPHGSGGRTFAELSAEEKNAMSHRGRAIRLFLDWLSGLEGTD